MHIRIVSNEMIISYYVPLTNNRIQYVYYAPILQRFISLYLKPAVHSACVIHDCAV